MLFDSSKKYDLFVIFYGYLLVVIFDGLVVVCDLLVVIANNQ